MPTNKRNLLLVEDDDDLGRSIFQILDRTYNVLWAKSIAAAMKSEKKNKLDVAILDVMLPDGDGIKLASYFYSTAKNRGIPILILSALGDAEHKISGLRSGADDYLAKPFQIEELLLRLEKIQTRYRATKKQSIELWDLVINDASRTVVYQDREIACSKREFEVLLLLASMPNDTLARMRILSDVWRDVLEVNNRVVDTTIARLRKKLRDVTGATITIVSVRGMGYKLVHNKHASNPV